MGAAVPSRLCCCSSGDMSGAAMDMVNVEQGLSQGGLLKEFQLHRITGAEEEVEFDYDLSLSTSIRPRSVAGAAARRQLLKAARQDDAPATLQLVADGADLMDVGEALRLAAYRGSAAVVRELVAVGLSVNEACPDSGLTSLQLAAASGHILVCELLLDAMADPNARSPSALTLARRKGHVEVEEVIERHVAAMLLAVKGEEPEEAGQYRRAHVLPRVSPVLSEAVMQALPAILPPPSSAQGDAQEPDAAAGGGAAGAPDGAYGHCEAALMREDVLPPFPLTLWPERPSAEVLPL